MDCIQGRSTVTVTAKTTINTSTARVWELIATAGNLNYCHPFCKEHTVKKWGGVGAEDSIHYYNGTTLKREFTKWHKNTGYELLIRKHKKTTQHHKRIKL